MKNIFFLVGERSADVHAAEVLKQVNNQDLDLHCWGIGGPQMQKNGFEAIFSFEKFSLIGFAEVLKHLPFLRKVSRQIRREFESRKPDLVILVDYPGFNMQIAKLAHKLQIPVLYYISPQFWAWKKKRIYKMKKYCNKIAVIFPFEEKLYKEVNAQAEFVGHPICEEINFQYTKNEFAEKYNLDKNKKWLGFFPGSRDIEVKRILPEFLNTVKLLSREQQDDYEFLISLAGTVSEKVFYDFLAPIKDMVKIIHENHDMIRHSHFVISKSGTSCLETALLGTPLIVVYKISLFSYILAKFFINIKMIAMPNIILGKKLIPELIQQKANAANIVKNFKCYSQDKKKYEQMKIQLSRIADKLGKKKHLKTFVK